MMVFYHFLFLHSKVDDDADVFPTGCGPHSLLLIELTETDAVLFMVENLATWKKIETC